MPYIDTPIRILCGRTAREALLLGVVAYAAYLSFGSWPEFVTATGVALLFALRVPQARPIAVGFCLGWLVSMTAMMVGDMKYHGAAFHLETLGDLRILIPAGLLLLLSSRDLFERFDAAPARFLPNLWRELPSKHWRTMRWSAYSLGVMSALVVPGWLWALRHWQVSAATPKWVLAGIIAALALLVIGSALGFLVAALVSSFTLITLAPMLTENAAEIPLRAGMLGPICASALLVLVLSAPYCLRLFRRPGAA